MLLLSRKPTSLYSKEDSIQLAPCSSTQRVGQRRNRILLSHYQPEGMNFMFLRIWFTLCMLHKTIPVQSTNTSSSSSETVPRRSIAPNDRAQSLALQEDRHARINSVPEIGAVEPILPSQESTVGGNKRPRPNPVYGLVQVPRKIPWVCLYDIRALWRGLVDTLGFNRWYFEVSGEHYRDFPAMRLLFNSTGTGNGMAVVDEMMLLLWVSANVTGSSIAVR